MKKTCGALFASLAGLGLIAFLVWWVGVDILLESLRTAGWDGFILLCLVSVIPTTLLGAAWQCLIPAPQRVPLKDFVLGRMVRDALADISPLTVVGGMVGSIRVMILRKLLPAHAIASAAVDAATEAVAQAVFIVLGIAICIAKLERLPGEADFYEALTAGVLTVFIAVLLAVAFQVGGGKWIKALTMRLLPWLRVEPTHLWALYEVFSSYQRLAASCALHFVAWVGGGLITYVGFHLVGADISLLEALAIEALLCLVKSAGVFVPASLGVQEAGYAMLAPLFGIAPELGLAVSLLRRARDVSAGVPALLVWQFLEGKGFWNRRARPAVKAGDA
jgi:putative membrane protein